MYRQSFAGYAVPSLSTGGARPVVFFHPMPEALVAISHLRSSLRDGVRETEVNSEVVMGDSAILVTEGHRQVS